MIPGTKHDTNKPRVAEILSDFRHALAVIAFSLECRAFPPASFFRKNFDSWFLGHFIKSKPWTNSTNAGSQMHLLAYSALVILDDHERYTRGIPIRTSPVKALSDLIAGLEGVIAVGEFGAKKYAMGNWKQVPDAVLRYTNAAGRHFIASTLEHFDQESQLSHISHLTWNLLAVSELLSNR